MIRSLFKLALLLVIGVLIYNYFFGTVEEKEQSKAVFRKVYDLGRDAYMVLRSEKEKFDAGKYDDAIDKVGGLLANLKDQAERAQDSGALERIAELEQQRRSIEAELRDNEQPQSYSDQEQRDLKREFNELVDDTEQLMHELEGEK